MNILLQLAIPLLVTFVVLVVIAIVRRYLKPEIFVISLTVLALSVGSTLAYVDADAISLDQGSGERPTEEVKVSLMLADQYMLKELYDEADAVLRDLRTTHGDQEEVLAASARCAMLQGSYEIAALLYQQIGSYEDELEQAILLSNAMKYEDDSVISYLEKNGYDTSSLSLSQKVTDAVDIQDAVELIRDHLHKEVDLAEKQLGSEAADAVKYAAQLAVGYLDLLQFTQVENEEELEVIVSKLNKAMKENVNLMANEHLRIARLKGCLASGDYALLAKVADRYCTTEELIVLAQLLSDGEINAHDFSSDFVTVDTNTYKKVLEACKETLKTLEDELSEEEYEQYSQKLEQLKIQLKEPVVCTLRQDLAMQVKNCAVELKSKVYMTLAKLDFKLGDGEQVDEYVADAIATSGECDDPNYSGVMTKLAGIVAGAVKSSEITNIAQYVTQAVEYSMPLELPLSTVTGSDNTEFVEAVSDDVNQSTAKLNIGIINKDQFPVIQSRVQIQSTKWTSIEELRTHLQVYDCGSRITEFTLEKMEFDTSRITLLCDVSGSMSGNVDSLKQAIITFAENMRSGEEVSVIGFNSGIAFVHEFTSDPEVVKSYAESIFASGGTALYDSVIYTGSLYNYDLSCNNVIIAMTDGQDGNSVGEATMYNTINAMAEDKDLTLYTLGLGSGVNVEYLEFMASCGNGSFLYVENQEKLEEFYDFIHGQLANQYILTYNVKNETLNKRKLEISLEEELGSALKVYYLQDQGYSDEGSDAYTPYVVVDDDLTVSGLGVKFLYKSSLDQTLSLRGTGFNAGDDVTIRLMGNSTYNLKVDYIDETTYQITVPADIVCGTYDLEVSIRGESFTLEDELGVYLPGTQTTVTFGAYTFTALNSYTNPEGKQVLSGNVVMNDWLCFKGELEITQEADGKLWLNDLSGCYITYNVKDSTGMAQDLSDNGIPITFVPFGSFYITDDPYDPGEYDKFDAQKIDYYQPVDARCMLLENSGVKLYPDMIRSYVIGLKYELPFQKQLMQNLEIGGNISGGLEIDTLYTAEYISLVGCVEYKDAEKPDFSMVAVPLKLEEMKITFDTLKGDYEFNGKVKFKALLDMEAIDATFAVKNNRFDAIGLRISVEKDIPIIATPIPVSFNNFGYLLSGFSKVEQGDDFLSDLLGTEIAFVFDVKIASLETYLPDIDEIIQEEDAALAELENCSLKLLLKEFRICFDADLKLLTVLDVGEVHVKLGCFEYTNALIGFYKEHQAGLQAALTLGLDWESPNLEVGFNVTGEVTVGAPYTGIYCNGNMDFEVGWWILNADVDVKGETLVGLYQNSSDNLQFSYIVKGTNSKGNSAGFHLYITRKGLDIDTY